MRLLHARVPGVDRLLDPSELAIARSVLYASLFDYPLTLAQLRQTLIESTQTPSQILRTFAQSGALQAAIEYRDGFFFPYGQYRLVGERRHREARSRRLLGRYRPLLALITALPYVRMVALSGSIAHLNLDGSGDLDLFIVTRGRHVWSVAVAVVALAKLLGQRRLLCANFVVSDERLAFDQQDLFTASQIIHLKPLVGQEVYGQLLDANPFVLRLYPNFHATSADRLGFRRGRLFERARAAVESLLRVPAAGVERLCRWAYGTYLTRRSSSWRRADVAAASPSLANEANRRFWNHKTACPAVANHAPRFFRSWIRL